MRKMLMVLRREYLQSIRTKMFWIGTLAMPLLMVVMIGLSIAAQLVDPERQKSLVVLDETGQLGRVLTGRLDQKLKDGRDEYLIEVRNVEDAEADRLQLESRILNGDLYGVVTIGKDIDAEGDFGLYRKSVGDDSTKSTLRSALRNATIGLRMERSELAIDREQLDALVAPIDLKTYQVTETETRQKGFEEAVIPTFLFVLILFITLYLYGFTVTRGIIQDKSNRVMEVLLGSVSSEQLITGKILGIGLVGLTQIAIYSVVGTIVRIAVGFSGVDDAGSPQVPEWLRETLADALSASNLFFLIVFFLLGYFLFSSIFAIVGAICNTEQEAQSLQFPVMMCLMIPYMLTFFFVRHPDSTAAVIFSMIPLFTPMVMFMRLAVLPPPWWQVALSIVFTIVAIWFMFRLAARVFRVGTLMYGKRPGLKEVWRWARVAS